jgi:hypothetical protein
LLVDLINLTIGEDVASSDVTMQSGAPFGLLKREQRLHDPHDEWEVMP